MSDTDFVIVGAGHNALVCAGYLAKAGLRVHVVERRPVVGGAVVTQEIIPGFKFDLGGSAHILINHTPIVCELGLLRGNVMHLEMSADQMFFFRPAPGAHQYRGPLPGLYLTGASTHPGGGIMGAAGRNASRVILDDLRM